MPHRIKIKHLTDRDLFDQDEIIWASSSSGISCPCLDEDYWDYYYSLIYDHSIYDPDHYDYYKNTGGFCAPVYSKEIKRRITIEELLGDYDDLTNSIENILKNK